MAWKKHTAILAGPLNLVQVQNYFDLAGLPVHVVQIC